MTYLLDTTAFSDLLREHPKMTARLERLAPESTVMICAIVRGEIVYGIERLPDGRRRRSLDRKAGLLFSIIPTVSVPSEAGDVYGRLKHQRQRLGLSLDENDLWIAATTLALGGTLVTRDTDFRKVDGLSVENWVAE